MINFFGPKTWGQKQWDILLIFANHSDSAVRPTSNMKMKVTLYITSFHSTLYRFLRCLEHLSIYILNSFPVFLLDFDLEEISEIVIIWSNWYFWSFCEYRRKGHIILPPWSDYSSPVSTQPSGSISIFGLACGHCFWIK